LAIEDVPVYLRYESSDDLSAGSYGTELMFEVVVDGFAR
jgi:hypothetical protein